MKVIHLVIVSIFFSLVACSESKLDKIQPEKKTETTNLSVKNLPDSLIIGQWRLQSLSYAKVKKENNIGVSYHESFDLEYTDEYSLAIREDNKVEFGNTIVGEWEQKNRMLKFNLYNPRTDFPLPTTRYDITRYKYVLYLERHDEDFTYTYTFVGGK